MEPFKLHRNTEAQPAKGGKIDRRGFFNLAGLTTFTVAAAATLPKEAVAGNSAQAAGIDSASGDALVRKSYEARIATAEAAHKAPVPPKPVNGDEELYPSRIGSDTRGLPHDQRGEVDPEAYKLALKAYESGDPAEFEKIPLGGTRKQLNPLGSLAANLTSLAPTQLAIPPAPALASAQRATEAVELYWQALLRDVPFTEYRNDTKNELILAAVEELNRLPDFQGPKRTGAVTPETLFRGTALYVDRSDATGRTGTYVAPPGTLDGPYISQFLLRDAPYGSQYISPRLRTAAAGVDFLTDYDEWLANQNGAAPKAGNKYDPAPRYIATGRDLAEYAHNNPAAYWVASLLLGTAANKTDPAYPYAGIGAPLSSASPYTKSKTQAGAAGSFGLPYFQSLLAAGTSRAIRVAYWHKFYLQRVLRPEAYAGLIHHRVKGNVSEYPVHETILGSKALERSAAKFGSHLLPHVYPEGAPIHSSYPGGASVIGAVNATLLKAFFDESFVIPNPAQPDPKDPAKLVAYDGPPLTVGGELNKLALNYGLGRNWAGIHWRSDLSASLALGEEVAVALLRDERATLREAFDGFAFTRFDGTKATI
jgi:hypothetical protein